MPHSSVTLRRVPDRQQGQQATGRDDGGTEDHGGSEGRECLSAATTWSSMTARNRRPLIAS
jgi:hypothetical protein